MRKVSGETLGMVCRSVTLAGLVLLVSCVSSDLGSPCTLLQADNTQAEPRAGHDVIQSGNGACEEFTCASFDGQEPICSRPCTEEGADCEEGLVCRRALLDPELLEETRARLEGQDDDGDGIDDYEQLLAGIVDALYCGPKPR